jgi:uncharacterized protein YabE (DUF348 family)
VGGLEVSDVGDDLAVNQHLNVAARFRRAVTTRQARCVKVTLQGKKKNIMNVTLTMTYDLDQ